MRLKRFVVNSGGQFSPDTTGAVVIDFSKSKFVGATGDQETGKSTVLELFLMTVGQNGGDAIIQKLRNSTTDDIETELEFVGKDKADYTVRNKNGRLTVKREGKPTEGGAVQFLRNQLGVVGVSPMSIKDAPIDKIVKWLAGYSSRGAEEFEADMKKVKDGIKSATKTRADANKSLKGLREYLVSEGVCDSKGQIIEKAWKEGEKKYANKPDIAELSKKLTAAGSKSDKFIENQSKVNAQKERKSQIEAQIKALQKELATVDENIAIGEKWLTANESAKKDYDVIKKQYDSAAQDAADYNKWQEIKAKKKEMDGFEDIAQKADAKEKELLKQKQELEWEVIPDIKGVEIILEDTHEDEGEQRTAGFYYKGMNSAQLSNSEWFGLVMQILKKNKINILVVDDISQFGSKFMEILEGLAEKGCTVLYTEMSRGQETLEIEYK